MARVKKTYKGDKETPFPAILGKLLDRKGETQEKLAADIGVQRQTISQWRYGNTFPDAIQLAGIADYYGVSTDYLLGRTDEPTPDTNVQAIHEKTGLSGTAIDALTGYKGTDYTNTINILLEDHPLISILTHYFSDYVNADRVGAGEDLFGLRERGTDLVLVAFSYKEVSAAFLVRAQARLIELRKSLKKESE